MRHCICFALVSWFGPAALAQTLAPPRHGPWENDLMAVTTRDGRAVSQPAVFVEGGGVPSVVRDAKGRLVAAFQWFPQEERRRAAFDHVAVKFSTADGRTWSEPEPVQVKDLPADYQRPFDPTLAALDDGRIRLYFTSDSTGRRDLGATTGIYSAISDDGVHYKFEPEPRFAVSDQRVIDCAVARFGKTWHLVAPFGRPEEGAYHAVSNDGLKFTRVADIRSMDDENWTGNLVVVGDDLRFYGTSRRGIWWVDTWEGRKWSRTRFTEFRGGDPAVVPLQSGELLVITVSPPRSDRREPRPTVPRNQDRESRKP